MRWLWRLLLEEHGWGRIWTGLGIAIALAGGGLIYQQVRPQTGACDYPNFPDATCTGVPAGTSLTSYSGELDVTTDNATVDAMDVTGTIYVNANNVTIKNTRAYKIVFDTSKTGGIVQDTEVNCQGGLDRAILGGNSSGGGDPGENITISRVDIEGCEDGIVLGDNVVVEDSWLHDPGSAGADPHNDGIQFLGASSNIRIEHNSISWRDTSDLQMCNNINCGTFHNVLIKHNYLFLSVGGAYNIYCPQVASDNFVIDTNAFQRGAGNPGYLTNCDGETVTGNYEFLTGDPVT